MSEYLKDINEFWEQYFSQYNSIYDESTLKAIIKNNDTTAFLHPMDYAYFQNISEIILLKFQGSKK
ncbi:hypothetical protein [Staphylococcus xylosus]|uniref:hypothetical protein n=1 Tax=Staphylococcus xylosus TaxID=1288 RepID=UPI0021B54332|nr:hypothetical protein [Staphylococcus xylosus]